MDIIINLIIFVVILAIVAIFVTRFLLMPTEMKRKVLKEFIYLLVLEAENEFGNGTGQAKLSYVIKMFYEKCPIDIRRFVPEQMIIDWIEEAVKRMKVYFETKPDIKSNILKG